MQGGQQTSLARHHQVVLGVESLAKSHQERLKIFNTFSNGLKIFFKVCHHVAHSGGLSL